MKGSVSKNLGLVMIIIFLLMAMVLTLLFGGKFASGFPSVFSGL